MWSSLQKFRHAAVNFLVYVFDRAHRAIFRAANALPGAALGDLFRILAARAQVSFVLLVDVGLRVCRLFALAHHLFGQLGRHIEIKDERRLGQAQKAVFKAEKPVEIFLPFAVRGITATKNDIVENPYNVEIVETEAAQIPNILQDVDYAVINSNYAINAGLNPVADSLVIEGSASAYANILAVKEGNESSPKVLALIAALESQQVVDYINEKYDGSVVSTVDTPTDGFDATVDYDALAGETISIAASPTPHAEILEVVKEILAEKNITLDIQVYNDYVVPNTVVEDGTVDANYFQHKPYLDDFNAENNTHIVSVAAIHVEPMGLYGGKQTTLDALSAK